MEDYAFPLLMLFSIYSKANIFFLKVSNNTVKYEFKLMLTLKSNVVQLNPLHSFTGAVTIYKHELRSLNFTVFAGYQIWVKSTRKTRS